MGNVTASIAARIAFQPPQPPSYEVISREGAEKEIRIISDDVRAKCGEVKAEVTVLDTRAGTRVTAAFLRHPGSKSTLLYSHGNSTDLGKMLNLLSKLRLHLQVNVMGYDYSGYGASTGQPTEQNTYDDIEAVYKCLKKKYGMREENIILYGYSLGSGPTLHLGAKVKNLGAIVLHSPILSGIRFFYMVEKNLPFDIFNNMDKIKEVNCPITVIHGTADKIVKFSHGKKLHDLAKINYDPLWVKGGGHGNLETFLEYKTHMIKFLNDMEKRAMEKPASQ